MREDWDRRAREDAQYYVAFGRRKQSREEFFASAAEVLHALKGEFRRFPPGTDFAQLSALEIGCGPGRLMLPLSEIFGRIAGVDVSGEMVKLARENLAAASNATVLRNTGADLSGFARESVDFCYSYAVFQHIPDKNVVWSYLREASRVLKEGGLLKCQLSGLPDGEDESALPPRNGWSLRGAVPQTERTHRGRTSANTSANASANTWRGVSFRPEEVAQFAADHNLQLLAMDGFDTQYLWMTARKRGTDSAPEPKPPVTAARIVQVTNTMNADAVVPHSGPFASASLWVIGLDDRADLNSLVVDVDGTMTSPCFIGKHVWNGPVQVNFYLPPGVRSGVVPVSLRLGGRAASNQAPMRVIGPGPLTPRILSVRDGVNLLSQQNVASRAIKVNIEELDAGSTEELLQLVSADLDGWPLGKVGVFAVDPPARRYELNLTVPKHVETGGHHLNIRIGSRTFAPVPIQISASAD